MEKFKVFFRKLLRILLIAGVAAIVIGAIITEINDSSYKEISKEDFTRIAIENKISYFSISGDNHYKMQNKSGEKYSHHFQSDEETTEFENNILKANHAFGSSGSLDASFYSSVVPIIVCLILGIILFYVTVVLWFAAFFDLLKSEFKENHNKWIWFISLLLVPFIAPLFYLYISKEQKAED